MTLELRNVVKRFPGTIAIDRVSFLARSGEITGYLGPNGSGKSTTMKMIAGLVEPSSGEILFDGRPIRHDLIGHKRRTGYVPEEAHLYSQLSGFEYLTMAAQLRDLPQRRASERIDGLLRLLSLHADRHAPISSYSKGMRQKISLSAALLHNPQILLLDEPFSGLDVASCLILRSLVERLAADGKVILFSSHELEIVEEVSARVVIIHQGRVVADGSVEQLRALRSAETLEAVFSQLAIEQDTEALSREIAQLVCS